MSMWNIPPCHAQLDVVLVRPPLVFLASETCLRGGD